MSGDDDMPLDVDAMIAEGEALAAATRDEMDRLFGNRPEGQEYRAEVDAEMLAHVDPEEEDDWTNALSYLGLDALDPKDPGMPEPLRALLTVNEQPLPALAWVGATVAALSVLVYIGIELAKGGVSSLLLLLPGVFLTALGGMVGIALDQGLRKVRILPNTGPKEQRDAALERLRRAPFVLTLCGKLVENVPSVAWLRARDQELGKADERCEEQIAEIEQILERSKELEDRLGEHDATEQREALRRRRAEVEDLRDRVRGLRAAIGERQKAQRAGLDRVRAAAELASLRDRSAVLLGQPHPDAAAKVAADLELEVDDLRKEFNVVHAELSDQEARWKAEAEVAGLAR